MDLARLAAKLPLTRVDGTMEREIAGIAYDSRAVAPDFLFVAMRGQQVDGHDFIERAIDAGAVAVLSERPYPSPKATCLLVPDTRRALADLAVAFYERPCARLKVAGVTGTNGKTTTAFLVRHLMAANDRPCGLIGTIRYEVGGRVLPAVRTTPESLDLQRLLAEMRDAGCRAAAMEVSSIALDQGRARHLELDAAVFTNLSQDHLDYHGTMEAYFRAKTLLFLENLKPKGKAIINIDDPAGQKLAAKLRREREVVLFGQSAKAHYRAVDFQSDFHGTQFQLEVPGRSLLVRMPLIGRYNIANALGALAATVALGVDLRGAVKALASAPQVPGRLQQVEVRRPYRVFVDYAHTPDGLVNALRALRDLNPGRIIAVFGCGGDRDRGKRPLMARAVETGADLAILTSDNPRGEDPAVIAEEAAAGFRAGNHEIVLDRHEAIRRAVGLARAGDIVLVAGKGHENYQEIAGQRLPFDDAEEARRAMEDRAREP